MNNIEAFSNFKKKFFINENTREIVVLDLPEGIVFELYKDTGGYAGFSYDDEYMIYYYYHYSLPYYEPKIEKKVMRTIKVIMKEYHVFNRASIYRVKNGKIVWESTYARKVNELNDK